MGEFHDRRRSHNADPSARWFAYCGFSGLALIWLVTAVVPLSASLIAVIVCAGPHNWMELRHMLTRMPARFGKLRPFFLTALGGIVGLSGLSVALGLGAKSGLMTYPAYRLGLAVWLTLVVIWVTTLILMRAEIPPRFDGIYALPAGLAVISGIWLSPEWWALFLLFLHPALSFWILDGELQRARPGWRPVFHRLLITAALGLLAFVYLGSVGNAWDLRQADGVTMRIMRHAQTAWNADAFAGMIVATHVYLEMLHYMVWILAIPCAVWTEPPWVLRGFPLVRRRGWVRGLVGLLLCGSLVLVIVLWVGFWLAPELTRDLYFLVAIIHVLAEAPLFLRNFRVRPVSTPAVTASVLAASRGSAEGIRAG